MLRAELSRQPYVKSHHSAVLMVQIGRTHRSVEFKHQNISAVLEEMGLPWIVGYKPKRNYQASIFGAIDRYLSLNEDVVYHQLPPNVLSVTEGAGTFVEAPRRPGEPVTPSAGALGARHSLRPHRGGWSAPLGCFHAAGMRRRDLMFSWLF